MFISKRMLHRYKYFYLIGLLKSSVQVESCAKLEVESSLEALVKMSKMIISTLVIESHGTELRSGV